MEYFIISVICVMLLGIVGYVLELNTRRIKQIAENKELNELTNSFPENIEICKNILKKLGNDKVKIKEDKEAKTSLYVIVNNTITIANIRDSFTRIQTIAHECLHSIQSKRMLWFNFIITNIYMIYFVIISILTILKIIKVPMLFMVILIFISMIHYFIRSMLETDAIIKARYVAKEYLEENNICDKVSIEKIITEYDKLNNIGIKFVNYEILLKNTLKVIIYSIICLVI